MTNYTGQDARVYQQTNGKMKMLFPGLERAIPIIKHTGGKLLDVGCGHGDIFPIVKKAGYSYYGLDSSADMLAIASEKWPEGYYRTGKATSLAICYSHKFDVVVISMLFPAISRMPDIDQILRESRLMLARKGKIIIGVTHPAFDHYMLAHLNQRKDVDTFFQGYFASGSNYKTTQSFPNGEIVFSDYHWTISDYIKAIIGAGLIVTKLDECMPAVEEGSETIFSANIPSYMILTCESRN